ncbi:MAG: DUF58 domain-containing protein [Alphaproteobacteria bacterium]|nr:DUF58 domain-containing protein [Alphaproteobacteria bacterium]MDA7983388.1 DUF58 domain-containing protein [Alphaproteobacteria bacterium]MDA7989235.1 DUF58 domain-containing protein [Alphaproteobacteria bacterium]MDA8009515.1 DUF58 domain-containing protein [Alphaproteobacteria bacterium]
MVKSAFASISNLEQAISRKISRAHRGVSDVERRLARAHGLAAQLPPLVIKEARLAGQAPGTHGRKRAGSGTDFWQFRAYQWGDSAAAIDWRQSARFSQVQIREREWQAPRNLYLWCDPSASMYWGTPPNLQKRERACLLLLTLAVLALEAGEAVSLLEPSAVASVGRARGQLLALQLEEQERRFRRTGVVSLPEPVVLKPDSYALLFSDFLDDLGEISERVRAISSRGVRGSLVQVLDPAELSLPWRGGAIFRGLEGEPAWRARRIEALREEYRGRLEARRGELLALARVSGWEFIGDEGDSDGDGALLSVLLRLHSAISAAPTVKQDN